MNNSIKRIGRQLCHKGKIVNFYADTMKLPNGKEAVWDYIEHPKCAAAVVPVLPDGKIIMVKQYRNAIERYTLEIPAGGRDSVDEPFIECASRELEEETGYRCENLEYLISIKTTVAFCNEIVDVYLAEDLVPGEQHLDDAEDIRVEAFELDVLLDKIYSGVIQDAKTVAAILAYSNRLPRA